MNRFLRSLVPAALRPLAWRPEYRYALATAPRPNVTVVRRRVSRRVA